MKFSSTYITRVLMSLIVVMFFGISNVSAQEKENEEEKSEESTDETDGSQTTISVGGKKIIIIDDEDGDSRRVVVREGEDGDEYDPDYDHKTKRRRKGSHVDGIGLDIGITNYYAGGNYGVNAVPDGNFELNEFRPASHVALHLFPTTVSLAGRGAVNLKTALTIDWNYYHFKNDVTIIEDGESIEFEQSSISFKNNNLMARYFQIPLLLNFNTIPGSDEGLRISVGVYGGVLWKSRTKQVSEENGKVKIDGDFYLNPYRYGLTARIDFKWFDLYLNYNLSELYAENEGPSTQTFTAGLNLIHF